MSNWSVGDREFTQVVTDHFRSDFDLVEDLTVVNTNNRTNHFWNDDHVSQVSSDNSWLFIFWSRQFSSSQLLHQTSWLFRQTTSELSSNSGWGQLKEVFSLNLQQLF